MSKESIKKNIFITLLLMTLLLLISFQIIKNPLAAQPVYTQWQGQSDMSFHQYAVFLSSNEKMTFEEIQSLRENIQNTMKGISETSENDNSFTDSFAAQDVISVSNQLSSKELNAFGIGGDYFFFHPYKLLGGSYINEQNFAKNTAVLDEVAAFSLFGSVDIIGKEIEIAKSSFTVSAIIQRENTKSDNEGEIYLHHSEFKKISTNPITLYEVILPEFHKGFSENLIGNEFALREKEIVPANTRFSLQNLMHTFFVIDDFIRSEKEIAYPDFENNARVVQVKLSILLMTILVLMTILLCITTFYIRKAKGWWKNNVTCVTSKCRESIRQKCSRNKRFESHN